ncbi:hypothetical protein PHYSODRAFT_347732 [Phytophthora sojae]|uniref:Putative restriction endonuclease domain-containing protein n=1 Tax=Phytophthora sojae (strain P6497) TaxID=1094619 RepID=G5A3V6_PHYSP|nr:hypothetical protein PHYSODRAFT_347732 [Phytophthora sojae]EGZ09456.1 hypothetical protein PHYSODRAFT_347732 [Phytophthora sojae]|eukprot:XP_009534317.1 hypothetical protein PHYSODRAFT_347732 [Phytophthora sojae]
MALDGNWNAEILEAENQVAEWAAGEHRFRALYARGFFLFKGSSSRPTNLRLYAPDISIIDEDAIDLPNAEPLPGVPKVVIYIADESDDVDDLIKFVAAYVNWGSDQGVVVDTYHEQVWVQLKGCAPSSGPWTIIGFVIPGRLIQAPFVVRA